LRPWSGGGGERKMRPLKGFLPWLSLAALLAAAVILTLHRESALPIPAFCPIVGRWWEWRAWWEASGWQEEEERGRKRWEEEEEEEIAGDLRLPDVASVTRRPCTTVSILSDITRPSG
jgi:hypothetical protein